MFLLLRNWSHNERLEKYEYEEIQIFNNFGNIEVKYEANDTLTKIKKDNTEIEQK